MNRVPTSAVIALAIVSTILFAAVVGTVRLAHVNWFDDAESTTETFLLLLMGALTLTFAGFVLFVLLHKGRS